MKVGDVVQWRGLNGEVVAVVRELPGGSFIATPIGSATGRGIPLRDLELGRVKLKLIIEK